MRIRILMLVVLMGLSASLIAQPEAYGPRKQLRGQQGEMRMKADQRGPVNGLNLTEEQRATFKQSLLATQKLLQPLHNKLGEVKARQKTLMTAENPDMENISQNIEKMEALRVDMAIIQAKHRLDLRAQLNDEQRLKFDNHQGEMMQHKGPRGLKQDWRMRGFRSMN